MQTGFGLDVDRLLAETPSPLFEEWRTLYAMEPWADERSDTAAGRQIMYQVAIHGGDPKTPADYMPLLKRGPVKMQTEEDIETIWDAVCDAMERGQRGPAKTG